MEALQRILIVAREHPFYRDALGSVARFDDVPVLDKETLGRRLATALREPGFRQGTYFSRTGGTTAGRPIYFPTDIGENRRQRHMLARYLSSANMIPSTAVVLNLFPYRRMVRSLEIFTEYGECCGATVLPVGAHATDEEAWSVAEQFGATLLAGMPSRLLTFARWLAVTGRALHFNSVLFAGEFLATPKQMLLRNVLGVERFSAVYGSAELGVVAWQADVGDPPVYRFPRELVHVEIHQPDAEGYGQMVATNLVRTRHPVLRYQTGDIGRLVDATADEVRIELRARGAEAFEFGGNAFQLGEFGAVLEPFAQWQIVLDFDPRAGMDRIAFRLVSDPLPLEERQREIVAALRAILEADDYACLVTIEFGQPELLLRNPETLKVPALVDLRQRAEA